MILRPGQYGIVFGVRHADAFLGVPCVSCGSLESTGRRAWDWLHWLLPAGEGAPMRAYLQRYQDILVTHETPDMAVRYALLYDWETGAVSFLEHTAPGPHWVTRFLGTLSGPPPEWEALDGTPPGDAPPWPARLPQAAREQPWGEERG